MESRDEIVHLLDKVFHGTLQADEPLFTLRGQDFLSAKVVRYWITLARDKGVPETKLEEAELLAQKMDDWHFQKYPD